MRALVTGGGGFIGRSLAYALLARGFEVRTFARSDQPELREAGIDHMQGDLQSADAVDGAAEGCHVIFHVAAKVGIAGAYEEFRAVNVGGTENILAACRNHGVGRLVFTSTPSVVLGEGDVEGGDESLPYPDHHGAHYPATKAEAERLVLGASGDALKTVSLRPHIVWGPGDTSLLPRVLARASRLRKIGPSGKKTDITFIDDVVEAHILAAEALATRPEQVGGQAYFISSGEPVEIWDFVNHLLDAAGRPPIKGQVSVGLAMTAARMIETMHRWSGAKGEPMLHPWVVHELTHSHWFDIGKARRDLGYEPKVGLEEGKARLRAALSAS